MFSNVAIYRLIFFFLFFFNDTATTEIYTLSLHDALPICPDSTRGSAGDDAGCRLQRTSGSQCRRTEKARAPLTDRKSTRLNSSHSQISYAVFCLKKKKQNHQHDRKPTNAKIITHPDHPSI